jgi:hypothetical protein
MSQKEKIRPAATITKTTTGRKTAEGTEQWAVGCEQCAARGNMKKNWHGFVLP